MPYSIGKELSTNNISNKLHHCSTYRLKRVCIKHSLLWTNTTYFVGTLEQRSQVLRELH